MFREMNMQRKEKRKMHVFLSPRGTQQLPENHPDILILLSTGGREGETQREEERENTETRRVTLGTMAIKPFRGPRRRRRNDGQGQRIQFFGREEREFEGFKTRAEWLKALTLEEAGPSSGRRGKETWERVA
ncbi:hypothetical protein AVEN_191685-1 [Araneus ventricosus]|uniref:Uncharacterized protein n=1 Tax=Araneus ventricosus TaxID=182803 RepID=A0A4Y2U929_ARAVE|nr:hypothetical protein AVEN_191685-1 [Araneus ventricosus]